MASKIKKHLKKIMCMLSAGMFFVMAVFYPLESFRADVVAETTHTNTFDFNYSSTEIRMEHNFSVPVPPSDIHGDLLEENDDYRFFYYIPKFQRILTTDSKYYAYRISVTHNSGNVLGDNIYSKNIYLSTFDSTYSLTGVIGETIYNGFQGSYWYVTEFADSMGIYYSHLFILYENTYFDTTYDSWTITYPSLTSNLNVTVNWVPYTIDDLTDEIYSTLQDIYSTNSSMLTKLNQIYTSIDTVETKLQSLVSIAEQIENYTDDLEGLLITCNSYLASIKSELEEQTSWLQKIYNAIIEYFGLQGDDSVEDMPDQEMDNMLNIESELLGDASASDLQNDLNVSIDADSGSFVWNLIDRLITSNSVVFGGFISVLSLGIVALILGR